MGSHHFLYMHYTYLLYMYVYVMQLTDLTRFKALADRFQREMEEDPSMCDVMDELENSDERADVRAPEVWCISIDL